MTVGVAVGETVMVSTPIHRLRLRRSKGRVTRELLLSVAVAPQHPHWISSHRTNLLGTATIPWHRHLLLNSSRTAALPLLR